MRRLLYILAITISSVPLLINLLLPDRLLTSNAAAITGSPPQDPTVQMVQDSPPDTAPVFRKAIPEDFAPGGKPALPAIPADPQALVPTILVRDVVVNNTDPNLANTDTLPDSEPSIAVNPNNPNEIVLTAFSGGWGANTPIWHSTNGGSTWTKRFTVPAPPGIPSAAGCPCDQSIDYGRASRLSGTFLSFLPTDVYSGTTSDPTMSSAFHWRVSGGVTQRTNATGIGNADQPWLLVNRDTTTAGQDDVYVAYDNFNGSPDMRVAVALGTDPPNFVRDSLSGTSGGGFINPGHRLAIDPRNGWVYSLFQRRTGNGAANSHRVNYFLNRSTDSGQTWGLNAMSGGIVAASADSLQGFSTDATFSGGNCTSNPGKFGTVNTLLGGVLHAAVNPTNGDVYYVFGNRDAATGNNRLSLIRLTDNGSGGLNISAPSFVTAQVQAALPSVAVSDNGTVGVLYTQFDGISGSGFPMFSAHVALSTDQGATFSDFVLENFLSSAPASPDCRQRVLGDYQEMKAVGNIFYGVFTGNGVPFGRTISDHDPIFFKVTIDCMLTCPANIVKSTDPNQCGAVVTYTVNAVSCGTVNCSPASGSFFPKGVTTVTCTAQAGASCSFTVTINDSQPPKITCPPNITAVTPTPGNLCVPVSFTVTATDNCPGVTVACVPPSGACFPRGTTTVNCTATDSSGLMTACSFSVTVFNVRLQDDSAPAITLLWDSDTGQYRFCGCGTQLNGVAKVTNKGSVLALEDQNSGRTYRVTATCDASTSRGTASLQRPPGGASCIIADRNIRDDTGICP